jgi:hypothetical protein
MRRWIATTFLVTMPVFAQLGPPLPPCISAPGGTPRVADVTIPQQGGGTLTAKVFAPDTALQSAPCPCITMLPGGGAGISSVEWAASQLARNGYVVVITLPASGGSVSSYNIAARSGIDFLQSTSNPFRSGTDTTRIGAAGWSLGARALTRTQEEDPRLDAIVAWDNLAISETGDAGSPQTNCNSVANPVRTPRVPALGQASDNTCLQNGIDSKKTAWSWWKQNNVPAFEVVFANSNHFWWSGISNATTNAITSYYTLAWFDRWLKNDPSSRARLMDTTPSSAAPNIVWSSNWSVLLSSGFRSAAFFDGIDCPDLRAGCSFCEADFSGDRVVDDSDFVIFAAAYENLFDLTGDLNADGVTDDGDFPIFAQSYDALVCP